MGLRANARVLAGRIFADSAPFRGKNRLAHLVDGVLSDDSPSTRVSRGGVTWILDTREHIQFSIFYHGGYAADVIECIKRRFTGRPAVFWDIGANIGSVSLPIAAQMPQMTVESFEPSPGPLAQLRRNIGLNPGIADRLHVHELALSNAAGTLDFYVSSNPANQGVGTAVAMPGSGSRPISVRALRGDELLATGNVPPPSVIKIDVEGWESFVLEGLRETLVRHRPTLVVEHSVYRLEAREVPLDGVIRYLEGLGYRVERLLRDGSTGPLLPLTVNMDLVATPIA